MVFGFGFNKTKVLASAERSVKQGKLQNAIVEYEKILAEDPKDLTVMNTVGDLYARVGNTEKATEYFRKIGDAYATDGFTVRAIAMYKKLTKQNPGAIEAVQKLGDLYTQQGLHNDARGQFLQVAEHHLRNNELPQAAAVFQKTLQLDPENSSLQTRLAELYVRIGCASEARDLYFRNAEALRTRGALDLADDALAKVCELDPNFGPATLMRGQVKFDSGDPEGAIQILEKVPDLDSQPEGLRTLLRSYLSLTRLDHAEPVARKLLQVYNDPSGVAGYGEALVASGAYEKALDFFSEHSTVMLASNQPAFLQTLQSLTGRVKSNPKALEQLSAIFQRAGNAGSATEVTELLAHAYVQQGELTKARDLYQRLAALEPENPQHAQNYRQILSRLSESLPPEPETGVQAPERRFQSAQPQPVADELSRLQRFEPAQPENEPLSEDVSEDTYPASQVEQNYPNDIGEQIEAALTDADLFDSYNLISKAIAPLEKLLPRVPHDVRINQRLASLYSRSGKPKEAAERCAVLEKIHAIAGFAKESRFYAELTRKYRRRAGLPPASAATEAAATVTVPPIAASPATPSIAEEPTRSVPAPLPTPATPVHPVAPPLSSAPVSHQAHEIDLSSEWEEMFEVEHSPAQEHAAPVQHPPMAAQQEPAPVAPHLSPVTQHETAISSWDDAAQENPLPELLDEVRFYISQGMWPEAQTAIERCALIDPTHPEVRELHVRLTNLGASTTGGIAFKESTAGAVGFGASTEATVNEFEFAGDEQLTTESYGHAGADPLLISSDVQIPGDHTPVTAHEQVLSAYETKLEPASELQQLYEPALEPPQPEPFASPVTPLAATPPMAHEPLVTAAPTSSVPEPVFPSAKPSIIDEATIEPATSAPAIKHVAPTYEPPFSAPAPVVHAEPVVPPAAAIAPPPPSSNAAAPNLLDSFVQDLEASLGDFSIDEPQPEAQAEVDDECQAEDESADDYQQNVVAAPSQPAAPAHAEPVPSIAVSAPAPLPEVPISAVPAPIAPAVTAPEPQVSTAEEIAPPTIAAASLEEERGALNDIFAEFKESVEAGSDEGEDPETHYNLGVAFKEMDLFDEAIGEFQKVCKAIERGHDFPQRIQAYTWLADCFLKKGVPDLAVRWYERALTANHIDYDTDTAIRYELACACDAAGDRQAALGHFMEVYGTNIDYRDVAERIKTLRS